MKFSEILATIFAFLTSLIVGIVFPGKSQDGSALRFPSLQSATMYLSSDVSYPGIGEAMPVNINLKANGVNIVAATARIVYRYVGNLPILPVDADPYVDGIQAEINEELSDGGWEFPVNQVVLDSSSSLVTIDLAAVNVSPEGYTPTEEIRLATIDTVVAAAPPKITFHFDKAQTKVISKEGKELRLQLKSKEFAL